MQQPKVYTEENYGLWILWPVDVEFNPGLPGPDGSARMKRRTSELTSELGELKVHTASFDDPTIPGSLLVWDAYDNTFRIRPG